MSTVDYSPIRPSVSAKRETVLDRQRMGVASSFPLHVTVVGPNYVLHAIAYGLGRYALT